MLKSSLTINEIREIQNFYLKLTKDIFSNNIRTSEEAEKKVKEFFEEKYHLSRLVEFFEIPLSEEEFKQKKRFLIYKLFQIKPPRYKYLIRLVIKILKSPVDPLTQIAIIDGKPLHLDQVMEYLELRNPKYTNKALAIAINESDGLLLLLDRYIRRRLLEREYSIKNRITREILQTYSISEADINQFLTGLFPKGNSR